MTWRQRLTKLEERSPAESMLGPPHYITTGNPERCDCFDCTRWRKVRQRVADAQADLEELVPGGVEVLNDITDEELMELVEWATAKLNELERRI